MGRNNYIRLIGINSSAARPVGKINPAKLKYLPQLKSDVIQLSQKVKEFIPLKTMKEAKLYAKENLGINDLNIASLDIANYTLQAFARVKEIVDTPVGITKVIGKPRISQTATSLKLPNTSEIAGSIDAEKGVLTIAENSMRKHIANHVSTLAIKDAAHIKTYLKMLCEIESGQANFCEITKQLEKLNTGFSNIQEIPNQTIFHEIFHRLHFLNCKDYYKMGTLAELAELGIKDTSITNEFLSPEIQKIVSDWKFIGNYAKTSPCEFVAEVGSAIACGIKPPKEIMELYYKYGGPKIKNSLRKLP